MLPNRTLLLLACAGVLLTGCTAAGGHTAVEDRSRTASTAPGAQDQGPGGSSGRAGRSAPEPQAVRPAEIPGLGPRTRAAVPAEALQAVVVTGKEPDSNRATAVLYEREPGEGWRPVAGPWHGHNALKGWTDDHRQGDLRSPVGVFGLTDAGGRLPDPGTKLPYDRGPAFSISGRGFEGEPLAGSFDHVVAVNYNRRPGTTPLDWTRPLGAGKGGGIWIHVDHGGPTQGCVSLPRGRMKELLRWLDPAERPVVVMGDAAALAR
jgi:L,D-peptidoglycan transpeptidase YkuD (ErfK/YbiS/YcfS/YnhG family)